MDKNKNPAPGAPGQFSPWTCGAKTGIGRALNPGSAVSFTIGRGVLNEVYFPQEDIACIRECVFLVADGKDFFSDERTGAHHRERSAGAGVPAYFIDNHCQSGEYKLHKEILADPQRNTVLQRVRFEPARPGLRLYVCLTPHLHNHGADNEAWLEDYKGMPMLFAASGGLTLALACDAGWAQRSVGFIGGSDGRGDLEKNKRLTKRYGYAGKGNVQLCAEPGNAGAGNAVEDEEAGKYPGAAHGGVLLLAIGFGHTPEEAAHHARSSLLDNFQLTWQQYVKEWQDWHQSMERQVEGNAVEARYLRESAAVLRISESRRYPGGIIASLSVPWGQAHGVNDGIGYHLVWPRDLVESAWGFLALGASQDALRILNYLFTTQEGDGRWSQNLWLDGRPCLDQLQMDQVALPLLLVHSCSELNLIDEDGWRRYLRGIREAANFILKHGPVTTEDRWEQLKGLSPFTLGAEVAALAAMGELFDELGDGRMAKRCRDTADAWNAQLETWTYVRGTETAKRCGVEGYYVRINPFLRPVQEVKDRTIQIKHHPDGEGAMAVGEVVSVDALALVRFGLRRADDPRILETIKVIDMELKRDLPAGPCWRRFTKDGYGENAKGDPFQGIGEGHSWPLLTGERAHYAIAAGRFDEARKLFRAMEDLSWNGLFPEQVWDREDIPDKDLIKGRYTSSAMPLTWAQAEYIKLAVSLRRGKVFDMPSAAVARYL
jgi:glucoamylase